MNTKTIEKTLRGAAAFGIGAITPPNGGCFLREPVLQQAAVIPARPLLLPNMTSSSNRGNVNAELSVIRSGCGEQLHGY